MATNPSSSSKPQPIVCTLKAEGNQAIVTVPAGITAFHEGDIVHFHCDSKHKVQLLLTRRMFAQVQIKEEMPSNGSIGVELHGDTFVISRLIPKQDDGGPDTGGDG